MKLKLLAMAALAACMAYVTPQASAAIVPIGSVTADMVTDFTTAGAFYSSATGVVSQGSAELNCQPGFNFGATCGLVPGGVNMVNTGANDSRAYFTNGALFSAVEIVFTTLTNVQFSVEALGMQYTQIFGAGTHTLRLDIGASASLFTVLLGVGDEVTISSISTGMAAAPVPLPAAGLLLLTGLLGAAGLRFRKEGVASA